MSTNLVKAVNLSVCKLYSVIKNVGLVCFLATNSHSFATATAFYTLFDVTLQFAERLRRIMTHYVTLSLWMHALSPDGGWLVQLSVDCVYIDLLYRQHCAKRKPAGI